MAYDVSGLPAYVEQHKFDLIAKSIAKGRTVEKVTVQTGIKGSATVNIIDSPVTFQANDCAFSPVGTTTLSQRTITVGDVKINEELCEKDLVGKYAQTMLRAGAGEEGKEIVFEEEYMNEKTSQIAYELEKADWQGDTLGAGNLAFYDGFLKVIDGSGVAIDGNVDAITVATGISSSNVISIMWGMYKSAPEGIMDAEDLMLFVGNDVFRCYEQAVYNSNSFHYGDVSSKDRILPLVGASNLTVCAVAGLTGTDRLILARTSNLIIGMDLSDDSEDFELWYSQDARINRFAVCFKRGTQVAFPDQVIEFTLVP